MQKNDTGGPAELADLHVAHHEGLVRTHRALAGALQAIGAAGATHDAIVARALEAGLFLLGHHHAESTVLFPGLRRLGQLRSADLAFLDGCERDHRRLHALCDRLLASAGAPHPDAGEIVTIAADIQAAFAAHAADEEAGLAPERLRVMIDRKELDAIGRELEALRQEHARAATRAG